MPKDIELALAAWRAALKRHENAVNGDAANLEAAVVKARDHFQQLSVNYMTERLDALHEAEGRRRSAVPSTEPFHQAAQDEKAIAADIWHSARMNDEDTPQTRPSVSGKPD